jgi:4'-phosphopantetheinyl transferase
MQTNIYLLKIPTNLSENTFNKLMSLINKDKQDKIKRFKVQKSKYQTFFAEILLRKIIIEKLRLKNSDIKYEYNKYGKPFLKNKRNFYFNISHSDKIVILGTSTKKIGIDIELIKNINFSIAEHYFTADENIDLNKLTDREKLIYFFKLWVLKESYIKAEGKGLMIPLKSFGFKICKNNRIIFKKSEKKEKYYFKLYNYLSEYELAICTLNKTFPSEIIEINYKDLINQMISYY